MACLEEREFPHYPNLKTFLTILAISDLNPTVIYPVRSLATGDTTESGMGKHISPSRVTT